MSSVNKVTLIGNLGSDPEIRRSQAGNPIVTLKIATSEKWKDKSGEKKEKTEWHTVVIFNDRIATYAETYLKKGMKVYLEGQIQTRKWQDKTGADRYSTEIVLQQYKGELQSLSPIESSGQSRQGGVGQAPSNASQSERDIDRRGELDDDVPF